MLEHDIAAYMEHAAIALADREASASQEAWNPHPVFPGVRLKALVRGADTGGLLSCHLVRIDPDCSLKEHCHEGSWELHEVIAGAGQCLFSGRAIGYQPGRVTVIPQGAAHEVLAGDKGLTMLAKFFPALA